MADGSRVAGRLPTVFLPHGGGPWPFVEGLFDARQNAVLAEYLRGIPRELPARPRALLVISAHWEAPVPTVMTAPHPSLLFDYYGFPPASYELTWPAPGDPTLAARVQALLRAAGFASDGDATRGFDHGAFVPLKVAFPDADVPAVQLSLVAELDPATHLAIGRALAPLRDEGVFIIGSGMSYHNMRGFQSGRALATSESFDAWLRDAALAEPSRRDAELARWSLAPSARDAHPREEHLLPLMIVAGAAGSDRGRLGFDGIWGNVRLSAFHYGGQ